MIRSRVAVAIATYRRPEMLVALLNSIRNSSLGDQPKIVVVDNDPNESARAVVVNRHDENLTYVSEPRPGISHARNAGIVAAGDVDFIAFVDDDETVSHGWLEALLQTIEEYNVAAVAGPMVALLNADCPEWVVKSRLFEHRRLKTGTIIAEAPTANLLVRRSALQTVGSNEWFRPDLGLTGGEDADLCRRLAKQGQKIVWCDEAVVTEIVPPERTRLGWLARRYRRFASVDYMLDERPRFKRTRASVGGAARMTSGLLKLGFIVIIRRRIDAAAFRRVFRGIGFMEAAAGKFTIEYGR